MASGPEQPATFLTRRKILRWSGFGILAGIGGHLAWPWPTEQKKLSPPAAANSSSQTGASRSIEKPPAELTERGGFLSHLGSEFQIAAGPDLTICRLIDVSEMVSLIAPAGRFESFSLLFSAPEDFPAESQIYRLSHSQMETMELFLSPVGKPGKQIYLEAVCSKRV